MRVLLVVHGFVQGVGYRAFVRGAAGRCGIKGAVWNSGDGSVRIIADGSPEALAAFRNEIDVDTVSGPQVRRIEQFSEDDDEFPEESRSGIMDYQGFAVERG
ncbi:MAG: acylphosphatase [Candidatus Marsarchaeota archaeon]|jgi:Acylphosphatases|nr:acylphosphatase [Candidatus Marsarchaeota archaeon]